MRLQAVQTVHEVAAQHMDLTPAQVGPGVLQQLSFNGTLFINLLASLQCLGPSTDACLHVSL